MVVEDRTHIVLALGTDSESEARVLAPILRAEQEAAWAQRLGEPPERRTARVIDLAKRLGHDYRPVEEIAGAPIAEVIARVEALPANAGATTPATTALLGGLPKERILVSDLFDRFEAIVAVEIRKKTTEQHRVWKSARLRAVKNFIAAVGDIPIDEITHDHARRWREWHAENVFAGKIKPESANKDFSNFGAMLNRVLDAMRLASTHPLSRIRIRDKKAKSRTRSPIPEALIRSIVLNEEKMERLNQEARDVLLVMVNTGARPSELIGLLPRHIHLDAPVPYISIQEDGREVKNEASIRDIPLVGVSLEAMQRHPAGFPSYFGRATSWGNLVNKYLRNAGLPAPLTAYGLRHAFSDRLVAANMTDRVIADAMGHGLDRERYGEGLPLDKRREVLREIAF